MIFIIFNVYLKKGKSQKLCMHYAQSEKGFVEEEIIF